MNYLHVSNYLYRAVSDEELDDIQFNGLRNKPGAYETGKLFALNVYDACAYGKINFLFDGKPNSLIEVIVPHEIYISSVKFEADGMQAMLIEKECLNLLEGKRLIYSPLI